MSGTELFWVRLVWYICFVFNICVMVLAARRNPKLVDPAYFVTLALCYVLAPMATVVFLYYAFVSKRPHRYDIGPHQSSRSLPNEREDL